ncbi:hypothetical protein WH47_02672 [Habropoda laboriosa]|uniref:Uncharacterized protein n=1 Tax=Habropoda laboriosa TaxID=597456 RepID=A0A0L7QX08_9HYME|nr:hypothetical protein WH47_02672 [Habropoda laboriosa]
MKVMYGRFAMLDLLNRAESVRPYQQRIQQINEILRINLCLKVIEKGKLTHREKREKIRK